MSGRYAILASAVHSSLPRLAAAAPATLLPPPAAIGNLAPRGAPLRQQQQRRLRALLQSPNPTPSPLSRVRLRACYPGAGVRAGAKVEAPDQEFRFYGEKRAPSRVVRPFLALRGMDPTDLGFRVRAVSSRIGTEAAEDGNETSSSSSGSEEFRVGGKYCVLLTGHSSDYTQNLYGGYGQMFVKLLGDRYDKWDICAVVDGQFPAEEELEKYDGFVITGSKHDAHGSEEWIAKLCALLQSLHEKKQKILGICFGHQVLTRALGGKTGKTDVGWEIGLRKIQTTTALASKVYAVGVPPVFRVMQSHQDQVQVIPPGGELLGFSDKTPIEVFAVGDHVLGIQGHPEFTEDVVKDLIDTRLSLGMLTEEEAKDARATLAAGKPDREALVQLCKGFLKRKR